MNPEDLLINISITDFLIKKSQHLDFLYFPHKTTSAVMQFFSWNLSMLFLLENYQIEWVLKKLFLLAYQKFQ